MDNFNHNQSANRKRQGEITNKKELKLFQYLASLTGWNLVIVADSNTPKSWSLDRVHFLSAKIQENMRKSVVDKNVI